LKLVDKNAHGRGFNNILKLPLALPQCNFSLFKVSDIRAYAANCIDVAVNIMYRKFGGDKAVFAVGQGNRLGKINQFIALFDFFVLRTKQFCNRLRENIEIRLTGNFPIADLGQPFILTVDQYILKIAVFKKDRQIGIIENGLQVIAAFLQNTIFVT